MEKISVLPWSELFGWPKVRVGSTLIWQGRVRGHSCPPILPPLAPIPPLSPLTVWNSAHIGSTPAKPLVSTLGPGLSVCQNTRNPRPGQLFIGATNTSHRRLYFLPTFFCYFFCSLLPSFLSLTCSSIHSWFLSLFPPFCLLTLQTSFLIFFLPFLFPI